MGFWDIFANKENSEQENRDTLLSQLKANFPDKDENSLEKIAAMAGLMARVAYVDLNIDQNELSAMTRAIEESGIFNDQEANKVATITSTLMQKLAGIENHLYTQKLCAIMDKNERFELLKLLFEIAASDGTADNYESEEIRTISKGLLLSHQHFIAARATVQDKLGTS